MSLSLKILPRAERDAQCIFDYIAQRSPAGAARWWNAFEAAMARLTSNPQQYPIAPEDESVSRELRQSFFKTARGRRYRVIFIVIKDEVRVLRIRGPGQADIHPDEMSAE